MPRLVLKFLMFRLVIILITIVAISGCSPNNDSNRDNTNENTIISFAGSPFTESLMFSQADLSKKQPITIRTKIGEESFIFNQPSSAILRVADVTSGLNNEQKLEVINNNHTTGHLLAGVDLKRVLAD